MNSVLWRNERNCDRDIQLHLVCIDGLPRTVLALLTFLMGAKGPFPQGTPANGEILSVVGG